jgi:PadR family transcriptional regulator, regulatory protein PadR
VTSRREFSPQTLSVLAALYEQPSQWQHGYALASQTGLKSGTLYPILIRLADRRLVEASWQEEQQPGRPRRHLYRLTAEGLASAAGALASAAAGQAAPKRQPAGRGAREPAGRGAGQPGRPGVKRPGPPGPPGPGPLPDPPDAGRLADAEAMA